MEARMSATVRLCGGTPVRPEVRFTSQFAEVHMRAAAGREGCGSRVFGLADAVICPSCDMIPEPAREADPC
jgi:hypothetical protein